MAISTGLSKSVTLFLYNLSGKILKDLIAKLLIQFKIISNNLSFFFREVLIFMSERKGFVFQNCLLSVILFVSNAS